MSLLKYIYNMLCLFVYINLPQDDKFLISQSMHTLDSVRPTAGDRHEPAVADTNNVKCLRGGGEAAFPLLGG